MELFVITVGVFLGCWIAAVGYLTARYAARKSPRPAPPVSHFLSAFHLDSARTRRSIDELKRTVDERALRNAISAGSTAGWLMDTNGWHACPACRFEHRRPAPLGQDVALPPRLAQGRGEIPPFPKRMSYAELYEMVMGHPLNSADPPAHPGTS